MALIDIDLRLSDLLDIGKKAKSALNQTISNNPENEKNDGSTNETIENINAEHLVIKCPGCGHKSAIKDGDGIEDRCEYCGTVIGN